MYNINNKIVIYILICLGCINISFNAAAIAAVIPEISIDLKVSDFLAAKIIPYYIMSYGIGALIYAPITRYIRYRTVLVITIALFGVSTLACGFIGSLPKLLFARVIMGVTGASIIPLGLILIGQLFDKQIRGRLVGGFFACSFLSAIVGIVLSGIIHWRWLFFIPGIFSLLVVLSFVLFNSDLIKCVHKGEVNYFKAFSNTRIRDVFIFIAAISFLFHGVHKWFGIYLSRIYQMDKLSISMFFLFAGIGGFVGQIVGGYISDKKGRDTACYIGIVGLAIGIMLLLGVYNKIVLGIIFVLIAMSWTIGHNGISTILTDFSEENRPIIASLNSSVRFVAGAIGFFVSSFFVEKSFSITFFVIGVLILSLTFILKKTVLQQRF
ncbi:MAG: MFS transporter [Candidatus Zapsychrus exili]|nr:MFS transporter [Candidatus Zapsychrus exili]